MSQNAKQSRAKTSSRLIVLTRGQRNCCSSQSQEIELPQAKRSPAGVLVDSSFFSYYLLFFIVIQLQLSAFSPHPSTPPQLNPPAYPTSTLPLDFVHVSFILVPVIPSPHLSLIHI